MLLQQEHKTFSQLFWPPYAARAVFTINREHSPSIKGVKMGYQVISSQKFLFQDLNKTFEHNLCRKGKSREINYYLNMFYQGTSFYVQNSICHLTCKFTNFLFVLFHLTWMKDFILWTENSKKYVGYE